MSAWRPVRDRFLAPAAPTNLGACRLLFAGWLFVSFVSWDAAQWARLPADTWSPVWLVELAGPRPSAGVLTVLGLVWKVALLLAAVGLWRPVSLGVAAVLGTYLLGLTASFGKANHDVGLLIVFLFLFWIGRSTDALSVDALLARRRGVPPPEPSGEYTWPIVTGRVLLALVFFAAGVAKLRHGGLDWIASDNLRWLFAGQQYTHEPPLDWAVALARYPALCQALAGGTVALELGYPLALVSRRLRPWLVLGMIGLQLGIFLFMGISYLVFLAANVVWVDWARLGRRYR